MSKVRGDLEFFCFFAQHHGGLLGQFTAYTQGSMSYETMIAKVDKFQKLGLINFEESTIPSSIKHMNNKAWKITVSKIGLDLYHLIRDRIQ